MPHQARPNLQRVVRHQVGRIKPPFPIIVVSNQWPCWLPSVLAFDLPLLGAYFPKSLHNLFIPPSKLSNGWLTYEDFRSMPPISTTVIVLASGTPRVRNEIMAKLGPQHDIVIFCCTVQFDKMPWRDMFRLTKNIIKHSSDQSLAPLEVNHADVGGTTNASHLILYKGVTLAGFQAPPAMPRTLSHLLDSATQGRFPSIPKPCPLGRPLARTPILVDSLLRREGLFDVHHPNYHIACPSVFATTKWVSRQLSFKEMLRTFDIPLSMDASFKTRQTRTLFFARPCNLGCSITPLVVTAIFRDLWGTQGGFKGNLGKLSLPHCMERNQAMPQIPTGPRGNAPVWRTGVKEKEGNEKEEIRKDDITDASDSSAATSWSEGSVPTLLERKKCSSSSDSSSENSIDPRSLSSDLETYESFLPSQFIHVDFGHIKELSGPQPDISPDPSLSFEYQTEKSNALFTTAPTQAKLDHIKEEHDLAKAVKSDDAPVPVHIWDRKVFRGPPTVEQTRALECARGALMRHYRRRLLNDGIAFLRTTHGEKWYDACRSSLGSNFKSNLEAIRDIMWRSTENNWFEYPMGSRLKFFRYPSRYRKMARDGVPIFFTGARPTSKQAQSSKTKPEEKAILKEKLLKIIEKRYLIIPDSVVESWIKYFGVPKGVLDGVVQDWRIVHHAGANGLNDYLCVWAPPFGLPKIDLLLRIVDPDTLMQDRDIGEMFLNFELHPSVRKYTGVDVGPLGFSNTECEARIVWWMKNLMGFSPSPYNSVKMYLISEEIIRGNRHDPNNAFQWTVCLLNLPGMLGYNPNLSWISKRRSDKSLASDFVCFIDDQRITGANADRINEVGHALSTRESYLGIQDALRKLRAAEGTCYPGAWAGAVVFNDEDQGIVVLTSQDKWDKLKHICQHSLTQLENNNIELDHKALRSDRGFLVYVTQAYPSMVPYLKGIHLSLETWRGGRDPEGWKLKDVGKEHNSMHYCVSEESDNEGEGEEATMVQEKDPDQPPPPAPSSGITWAVPRLEADLQALLLLSSSEKPRYRVVRGKIMLTAFYGFGDASSGGFGATVERPDGIHGRYGLWGRDQDDTSSNFKELLNLVHTVEEEAAVGHLQHAELWLFTDNSTAENCFVRGSSKSKLLHELVLRLRKVEMDYGVSLFLVHCAGTRMIAQGTDGLSRGTLLEGVLAGKSMLSFIDISKTAIERHPPVLCYINSWAGMSKLDPLTPEEWFVEGHGIIGGEKDHNGIWIPSHAKNGRTYLWTPPPVIADVALEECMKAIHKRTDAYHIFVIPRLFTPKWRRAFLKVCDFHFSLPVGSTHWPLSMHEPLWIRISLPLINKSPWTLQRTPVLVELERDLPEMLTSGKGDERDIHILCQLL